MAELDDAYANRAYVPEAEALLARLPVDAAAFRESTPCTLGIAYGAHEREAFDVFLPEGEPKGCMIFVHGGYWIALHRSDWSHLAAGALAKGWAVAMPSYRLCPDVRIADITQEIAAAVEAIADHVDGPLTLVGHSAGGHLVARMLAPGMLTAPVRARLARVVPISPLSDLEPFLKTSMNDQFQMDVAAARAESPMYQTAPEVPVTVWVGGAERPAFLDQAQWLVEAWGCGHVVVDGHHHFNVVMPLAEPGNDLVRLVTEGA
jgi:acetyl esterase/lipase